MLVGVEEQTQELVVGIIDFIRPYTWDKQLESWVKTSGILGGVGPGKDAMPTIISPDKYKKRFRQAMTAYFYVIPDALIPRAPSSGLSDMISKAPPAVGLLPPLVTSAGSATSSAIPAPASASLAALPPAPAAVPLPAPTVLPALPPAPTLGVPAPPSAAATLPPSTSGSASALGSSQAPVQSELQAQASAQAQAQQKVQSQSQAQP